MSRLTNGRLTVVLVPDSINVFITNMSFSALRFGNPLLVQDVENYDPILNPVLNKELKRTGGRVLITLGDQVLFRNIFTSRTDFLFGQLLLIFSPVFTLSFNL